MIVIIVVIVNFSERKLVQGITSCVMRPVAWSIAVALTVWKQPQTVQILHTGGEQSVCCPTHFVWWALRVTLFLMCKSAWFQACSGIALLQHGVLHLSSLLYRPHGHLILYFLLEKKTHWNKKHTIETLPFKAIKRHNLPCRCVVCILEGETTTLLLTLCII